ncbi:uracil-DNA glycosylase [Synechococcus sp. HB1133]|uniref:uracil-DNA glycosylase n=1 Tax=unclassified Synechococcus TaxID=2626047 RepID=UPI00140AA47B|nr:MULTISPECIES: uracil-DNA glycosylase [unclassified Synechococcus]MCB4394914.1 uracil-DNA glycosylase [Synechococcus sp. PH41509]MCB4421814.1 uracil-DNA glycosylase [Synechococcus sp. HB1133]MCB4430239.1 uracil-DNA glycosylase [Synechococcus sp. HBA1120]NHI80756.1 uracil-DNA glycosylase [Synechococcus sp. HB1133]
MTGSSLENCHLCTACELASTRQTVVISRGNPNADLMLIGEAPGAQEDDQGIPFVGRSGRALDQLLREVDLDPSCDLYICNAIKCRPPNNRRPKKAELAACRPWLNLQLEAMNPKVIVLTGATAVEAILGIKGGMTQLRGQWQSWNGRAVMPIFHPSYLLRNPSKAAGAPLDLTRQDLAAVRHRLCEPWTASNSAP